MLKVQTPGIKKHCTTATAIGIIDDLVTVTDRDHTTLEDEQQSETCDNLTLTNLTLVEQRIPFSICLKPKNYSNNIPYFKLL